MKRLIAFLLAALLCAPAFAQTCTTTLDSGANIEAALSSAVSGATICLNAGSYPGWDATIIKTAYTTVTAAPGLTYGDVGIGAVSLRASRFIRIRAVTMASLEVGDSDLTVRSVIIIDSRVHPGGTSVWTPENDCLHVLFDGNLLTGGRGVFEGRLSIRGFNNSVDNCVVIRNNVFEGTGGASQDTSDGIFIGGGARGTTIGPGNIFRDIIQNPDCTADISEDVNGTHCDPIQLYGAGPHTFITGNLFYNNSTGIVGNGDDAGATITHNVFNQCCADDYPWAITQARQHGAVIEHNSLLNGYGIRFGDGAGVSTNATLSNNIISGNIDLMYGQTDSDITATNNLLGSAYSGTGNIVGSPTHAGGSNPAGNWQGYRLTSGSAGKGNSSDDEDRGANYFHPTAPGNFQVN